MNTDNPEFNNIVNNIRDTLVKEASFLDNMASIYPGDPDGTMSMEIGIKYYLANMMDSINWTILYKEFVEVSKMIVTYGDKVTVSKLGE